MAVTYEKKDREIDVIDNKLVNNEEKVSSKLMNKNRNRGKREKIKKIRMSMTKSEEEKLDKALERDNKVSTLFMVAILVFCFIAGVVLGCVLYGIALNGGK